MVDGETQSDEDFKLWSALISTWYQFLNINRTEHHEIPTYYLTPSLTLITMSCWCHCHGQSRLVQLSLLLNSTISFFMGPTVWLRLLSYNWRAFISCTESGSSGFSTLCQQSNVLKSDSFHHRLLFRKEAKDLCAVCAGLCLFLFLCLFLLLCLSLLLPFLCLCLCPCLCAGVWAEWGDWTECSSYNAKKFRFRDLKIGKQAQAPNLNKKWIWISGSAIARLQFLATAIKWRHQCVLQSPKASPCVKTLTTQVTTSLNFGWSGLCTFSQWPVDSFY